MKRLTLILLTLGFLTAINAFATEGQTCASPGLSTQDLGVNCTGSYYNWGKAQNGWGYCYEWACTGDALNGGQPVGNYFCESSRPSFYDWGQAQNGWGYCYQYTAAGIAMNEGQAVSDYSCESRQPSHYSWGHSTNGDTHCYQYTPKGVPMNQGQPVGDYFCK